LREWKSVANAVLSMPFIGPGREESGQEVKGNRGRWLCSIKAAVSIEEMSLGGEMKG
jgi:hypothetical protein